MTDARHATLAAGRWNQLTLVQQLANIGSEVGRAARAGAPSLTQSRAASSSMSDERERDALTWLSYALGDLAALSHNREVGRG